VVHLYRLPRSCRPMGYRATCLHLLSISLPSCVITASDAGSLPFCSLYTSLAPFVLAGSSRCIEALSTFYLTLAMPHISSMVMLPSWHPNAGVAGGAPVRALRLATPCSC